MPDSHL